MAFNITRRTMLAGAGAGAAIAATGGALLVAGSDTDGLIRSILNRLVGPFAMTQEDFDKMVKAIDHRAGLPRGPKLRMMATLEKSGWSADLLDRAPRSIRDRREMIERAALTEFVIQTNYLDVQDKAHDQILYLGRHPCSSPFANFEMT
ncbi:hypothetical protein ASE00_20425 [Sphingomonas sp. Root710]|uniref:hypothetical protein n=1 Tax=Sphingomonas sp. Root710 TaxID=1736594 RepID=UPI0006FDD801|nr:hypothetical protein [Sphingomonas sp. Root710]KRB79470.1 hypothetical protein ASE00_20425 [Sphingomonas sp. Root710]